MPDGSIPVWYDLSMIVRGKFLLFAAGFLPLFALHLAAQTTITCESDNGRRNFCSADTRGGVRLVHRRSDSPCRRGYSWGYDDRGIWVDRGCRADFVIRAWHAPGPGGPGRIVYCASENGRRNFCPADTRRGVRLVHRRSDSPCRRGYSWGYDARGVWVDRGCRAEFRVR